MLNVPKICLLIINNLKLFVCFIIHFIRFASVGFVINLCNIIECSFDIIEISPFVLLRFNSIMFYIFM